MKAQTLSNWIATFPRVRYFTSKKSKFVEITNIPFCGISTIETKPVSGVKEARKIASDINGVAWNF